MHLDDSARIMFKQCSGVLYYYDMTNMEHNTIFGQVTDYTFLNTVKSNKSYFHQCESKGTNKAIIIQQLTGCPSTNTLKESV